MALIGASKCTWMAMVGKDLLLFEVGFKHQKEIPIFDMLRLKTIYVWPKLETYFRYLFVELVSVSRLIKLARVASSGRILLREFD